MESPHRSNTVSFKVDKRGQIVEVASHWAGLGLSSCNNLPSFLGCDGFVAHVYGHVGVASPSLMGGPVLSQVQNDTGDGAILFFPSHNSTTGAAVHLGIVDGGGRIDNNYTNNCENNPPTQRAENEGVGDWYDAPFSGSPIDPASGDLLLDAD